MKISIEKWDLVFKKTMSRCFYCGDPADCIDHIIPRSKNGGNEIENLNPSCLSCNSSKSNMTLEQFRKSCYRKIQTTKWQEVHMHNFSSRKVIWRVFNDSEFIFFGERK